VELSDIPTKFWFDNSPPDNVLFFINNDLEYTSSHEVHLSMLAEDLGSGVVKMGFSNDGTTWSEWMEFNNSYDYFLPASDGEKTVYFKVQDYAGNTAEPVADTILLDTSPPEELVIIINDAEKYSNSKDLTLTLHAVDKISGAAEMSFSYDQVNWLEWEPFSTGKTMTLFSGDGQISIYFRVRDKLGNTAEPVYDSIIIDTTPPKGVSITIDDGASETNSNSVVLSITAVDSVSGVDQIALSSNGATWTPWEPYRSERLFTIPPENGIKTVHIMVKDHMGNIAEPKFDSIILNLSTTKDDSSLTINPREHQDEDSNWLLPFVILLIIIIVLCSVVFGILVKKRGARKKELALRANAVTIKPNGFSGYSTPRKPSPSPDTFTFNSMHHPHLILSKPTPRAVPTLATSTSTTPAASTPKHPVLTGAGTGTDIGIPQVSQAPQAQLPRLPPAVPTSTSNTPTLASKSEPSTPTVYVQLPEPDPEHNPSTSTTENSFGQSQTPEPANGPVVHLPDSE
jgi:hypothetical protein